MNLEEYKAHVLATRKANTIAAMSVLADKVVTTPKKEGN